MNQTIVVHVQRISKADVGVKGMTLHGSFEKGSDDLLVFV